MGRRRGRRRGELVVGVGRIVVLVAARAEGLLRPLWDLEETSREWESWVIALGMVVKLREISMAVGRDVVWIELLEGNFRQSPEMLRGC